MQMKNSQPTYFYSDFPAMNKALHVKITPRLGTEADDDFIGFALGFMPGDTRNPKADFLLVDWKSYFTEDLFKDFVSACGPGGAAKVGLAVSRVQGIPNADEFWQHTDQDVSCSPKGQGLTELARGKNLGDKSYSLEQEYDFTFEFSNTSLKVYVDGVPEIIVAGSFNDGRLAFYGFSQAQVIYRISR